MTIDGIELNDFIITGNLLEEQETLITIDYFTKRAEIYTTKNSVLTRIKKAVAQNPEGWELKSFSKAGDMRISGKMNYHSVTFYCPIKAIRIVSGLAPKITEDGKERLSQLMKARFNKQEKPDDINSNELDLEDDIDDAIENISIEDIEENLDKE